MALRNIRLIESKYARVAVYAGLAVFLAVHFKSVVPASQTNGFDLQGALVPREEIYHGGPPRDGIPAIDRPRFMDADRVDYLAPEDRVLGVERQGIAKAYPVKILNHHEIVNDHFGAEPVVISYCPLCGSGIAYSAEVAGRARTFGVSGLLYNSDLLLYDRQSESLWSQLLGTAVSGPLKGYRLEQINLSHTTWSQWRARHPDSLVLSTDTGYRRDYSRTPYEGYERSEDLYFPVTALSRRYHPKELVIGVSIAGRHKAYPFSELARTSGTLDEYFNGARLRVSFDAANRTGEVLNHANNEVPSIIVYWFAWYAFHPDTEVFSAK